jgi:hypothetical protein
MTVERKRWIKGRRTRLHHELFPDAGRSLCDCARLRCRQERKWPAEWRRFGSRWRERC